MSNVSTIMKQGRNHTRRVASEILDLWEIYWMWIDGAAGHHAAGRAVDLMTLTANQRKLRTGVGNEIAAYVRRHHKRLGVEYVIWRQRIWNATRADDAHRAGWSTWRKMTDRGSPTANHLDHVHISFLNQPPAYKSLPDRTPASDEVVYTVKRGDTLLSIASRHKITVAAIADRNSIPNPDRIFVGQLILIPK